MMTNQFEPQVHAHAERLHIGVEGESVSQEIVNASCGLASVLLSYILPNGDTEYTCTTCFPRVRPGWKHTAG